MVIIREIADTDFIPLAEFLPQAVPFKTTTRETWLRRFSIWWAKNPAYEPQFPKGWILEHKNKIVGFIGNIPVKFLICGEVKTAAAAVSWYVDPSVRGLTSIRLFHEYLKQNHASLFLFNTDRSDLIPLLVKNNFREYILPQSQTEYGYILNRKNMDIPLRDFLFLNTYPRVHELLDFLRRFGMVMHAYVLQKSMIRGSNFSDKEYITSLCTFCDDSFSRIWEPYTESCDITLSRDTNTLNWIYFSATDSTKRIVIQCRRSSDNSLAGYMVFDILPKKTSDMAIMYLMDMCFDDNDPHVIASLIAHAIETGRHLKVTLLVVWADSPETETYFTRNFVLRKPSQRHNYIRLPQALKESADSLSICPSFIAPPRGIDHFA